LTTRALRLLRKLPPTVRPAIARAINDLANQPRPPGVGRGPDGTYKVRVGDYRFWQDENGSFWTLPAGWRLPALQQVAAQFPLPVMDTRQFFAALNSEDLRVTEPAAGEKVREADGGEGV
jgi:hypothetical protein